MNRMRAGQSSWRRVLVGLGVTVGLLGSSAAAQECPEGQLGCFGLSKRWEVKGFYFATGASFTEKQGNIATKLRPDATVTVPPESFPQKFKLVQAYMYWSGARETPDKRMDLLLPGTVTNVTVNAERCYADWDGRAGSISKQFYTCRGDITEALLTSPGTIHGTYTAFDRVDATSSDLPMAVILPGGSPCTDETQCAQRASEAAAKPIASCQLDDQVICKCTGVGVGKSCSFDQSTIGHASFGLVFVYEDGGDQTRTIVLYDGMKAFIEQTKVIDLQNVQTPLANTSQGRVTYYVVEGDNDDMVPYFNQSIVPADSKGKALDNPGEKVTLVWDSGTGSIDPGVELASPENPLWDDPFNGTTGAGSDIESYAIDVPPAKIAAQLRVASPHLAEVTEYPNETCIAPNVANLCGVNHDCKCKTYKPNTNDCEKYSCFDLFNNDGIGVAFVMMGFDSFAPVLVGSEKEDVLSANVGGVAFDSKRLTTDGAGKPKILPVETGAKLLYRFSTKNDGSAVAAKFKLVDPLPKGLVPAPWNGNVGKAFAEVVLKGGAKGPSGLVDAVFDTTTHTVTISLEDLPVGATVDAYLFCEVLRTFAWAGPADQIANQARFETVSSTPVNTDDPNSVVPGDATVTAVTVVDGDKDGILDHLDNCPTVANPDQANLDAEDEKTKGLPVEGDACDSDIDGDDVPNDKDSCPKNKLYNLEKDKAECTDTDGDTVSDAKDNCKDVKNPDQKNHDNDVNGDECDPDDDNDGLEDEAEKKAGSNPFDTDSDNDGATDGQEVKGIEVTRKDGTKVRYTSDPTVCDTDKDGLPDGLEMGITTRFVVDDTPVDAKAEGCHFIADSDPTTTTNPKLADTDGGGVNDGNEERVHEKRVPNGKLDPDELNPLDPSDDVLVTGGSALIKCSPSSAPPGNVPWLALLLVALVVAALRRVRRALLPLLVVLSLLPALLPAQAQAQEANYNPFRWSTNSRGILLTDTGEIESPFEWYLGLGLNYADKAVVTRDPFTNEIIAGKEVVNRRLGADIFFAIGLASWFELATDLPLMIYQQGRNPVTGDDIPVFGLGDLTIIPKFKLAGSTRGAGYVTFLLPFTVPTGKATKGSFAQEPLMMARPTFAFSYGGPTVTWGLDIGAAIRMPTSDGPVVSSIAELQVSTGFKFAPIRDTSFILWDTYAATQFKDTADTNLETMLAYRHRFGKVYATLGGGLGILRGRGTPSWRAFLSVAYASERLDRDGDGIDDDSDKCIDDPEDKDDFEDTDGCPEPDNDKDGILDARDQCKNDPEDFDGFQDEDGCPEDDNDKDGIKDDKDKCKNDPEDFDKFEDEDGCPEPDNDRDGVLDVKDSCPNEPEDLDAFEDTDGCPEPDNDKDGLCDPWVEQRGEQKKYAEKCKGVDKCPLEPENKNGYNDDDGCPDVMFTCDEFKIADKVNFATGSHKILPNSFKLLDVVAETMKEHPEAVEIEVQGHTDIRGSRAMNTKLSDRRANSVKEFLVKKGVAPERLTSRGYGPDVPLEPGKVDKAYWDQNRRVQFKIQKMDATKSEKCRK